MGYGNLTGSPMWWGWGWDGDSQRYGVEVNVNQFTHLRLNVWPLIVISITASKHLLRVRGIFITAPVIRSSNEVWSTYGVFPEEAFVLEEVGVVGDEPALVSRASLIHPTERPNL